MRDLESRPQTVLIVRPLACVELTFHVANRAYKHAAANCTQLHAYSSTLATQITGHTQYNKRQCKASEPNLGMCKHCPQTSTMTASIHFKSKLL